MDRPHEAAETWRAGDIAECIRDSWRNRDQLRCPIKGDRAMVLEVVTHRCGCGHDHIFLSLLSFGERWDARAFRKIVLTDVGADRRVSRPVEELV